MNATRRSILKASAAAAASAVLTGRPASAEPTSRPATGQAYEIADTPKPVADSPLLEFTIRSDFQRGPNVVRVLLPSAYDAAKPTRVLYLLPVEERLGTRWGDAMAEVLKTRLHDKHHLICIYPTFDTLPWYGDHASDAGIRHESYLLHALLPAVESLYKTPGTIAGRLLLGFSKSGFGSVSLVLRNPGVFGVAGSWDAPLLMEDEDLGLFGTRPQFGTRERFAEYRPLRLIDRADEDFTRRSRLVIAGEDSFGPNPPARFKTRPHTATFHAELDRRRIRHVFTNDLRVKHHWNTGWVESVANSVVRLSDELQ